jgi:hypothetical protein
MSANAQPAVCGGFRGSPLYHSFAWFEKVHGPAAAHAVISRLPAQWRPLVRPNEPAFGVLGARVYPYPFVGEMLRTMRLVVGVKDEDVFLRDVTSAAIDALLSTMHRILIRWLVSPKAFLDHRQEIWDMYHDTGKLHVLSLTDKEFLIEDAEWANTEPLVCKVTLEGRRRMMEVMGVPNVEIRREKCRSWGHDTCQTRVRWG